jgi:hypothetical protein
MWARWRMTLVSLVKVRYWFQNKQTDFETHRKNFRDRKQFHGRGSTFSLTFIKKLDR